MNDQKIALTLPLVNAVLQYLGTKPYQETAQLIQAIQEQAIPQMPVPASAQSQGHSEVIDAA
jgi:hypothetical protein